MIFCLFVCLFVLIDFFVPLNFYKVRIHFYHHHHYYYYYIFYILMYATVVPTIPAIFNYCFDWHCSSNTNSFIQVVTYFFLVQQKLLWFLYQLLSDIWLLCVVTQVLNWKKKKNLKPRATSFSFVASWMLVKSEVPIKT